ncbi:helix-turn-helix domain-containing protein [Tropicimonas marinistellae]|uniref:helix-turn-helix domain-containing protein n=1 Tax=Tropicimonas marinistellae TaxID=1739787 RepID=UPI00082A411E|nr:helix-turn-helix domain-containing protein [Tropicimonas marinistellae]
MIVKQTIQAERIRSALTATEFAAAGARSSLFVLVSGSGRYRSDDLDREVEAPCVIWSPMKHKARLTVAAGTRGFVLRAPERTVGRALPTGPISAHVRRAVENRSIVPDLPSNVLARFQSQFDQIESELYDMAPGALSVVHHCFSLLLIEIWRVTGTAHRKLDALPHQIVDEFLELVEQHLQDHWTVTEYARQLGVSRDKLTTAVQRAIGTSPHRHVQSRLVEEAKTLLLHSNLHVAEVAYALGFSDAAYFNRFFQRHMSVAPGRFRMMSFQARGKTSAESFAAWP